MTFEERQVRSLLREHGAVLERQKRHEVWRLPDGSIAVLPSTPSDWRSWRNRYMELQAKLGLFGERGIEGERRERKTVKRPETVEEAALTAGPLRCLPTELKKVRHKVICHPQPRQPKPDRETEVDLSGLLDRWGGNRR